MSDNAKFDAALEAATAIQDGIISGQERVGSGSEDVKNGEYSFLRSTVGDANSGAFDGRIENGEAAKAMHAIFVRGRDWNDKTKESKLSEIKTAIAFGAKFPSAYIEELFDRVRPDMLRDLGAEGKTLKAPYAGAYGLCVAGKNIDSKSKLSAETIAKALTYEKAQRGREPTALERARSLADRLAAMVNGQASSKGKKEVKPEPELQTPAFKAAVAAINHAFKDVENAQQRAKLEELLSPAQRAAIAKVEEDERKAAAKAAKAANNVTPIKSANKPANKPAGRKAS